MSLRGRLGPKQTPSSGRRLLRLQSQPRNDVIREIFMSQHYFVYIMTNKYLFSAPCQVGFGGSAARISKIWR